MSERPETLPPLIADTVEEIADMRDHVRFLRRGLDTDRANLAEYRARVHKLHGTNKYKWSGDTYHMMSELEQKVTAAETAIIDNDAALAELVVGQEIRGSCMAPVACGSASPTTARTATMTLDEAHTAIGAGVVYDPGYGTPEDGVITGVSTGFVFVRYRSDCASKATRPEDLAFLSGGRPDNSKDSGDPRDR